MNVFIAMSRKIYGWMNTLAGFVLFFMMLLTVADVILRMFGTAIIGTYELVAVSGAIVIGFAVPQTTLEKGHVNVDFLVEKRSAAVRKTIFVATRIVALALFALLSYRLYVKGVHLYRTEEVSLTLRFPYYPAAFVLAFCFLVMCFSLVSHIVEAFTKESA